MASEDRAWLGRALTLWQQAESDWLGLDAGKLPLVVTLDERCSYHLPNGDFAQAASYPHGPDGARLDGQELPLGPVSFADGSERFVMSLPSLWRAAGVTSEIGLETLMEGVLLHEILHTRQAPLANAALERIEATSGEKISDDRVQEVFEDLPGYVAAYEAERDLLFAAAAAPNGAEARRLATEALGALRARRGKWFTGDRSHYAEMDDIFLTMEGMGQWLAYRHFRNQAGLSDETALGATRRGGRWWSQDEGLALILVVDRLLPDWRARAFRAGDWRAEALLAAAVGERR